MKVIVSWAIVLQYLFKGQKDKVEKQSVCGLQGVMSWVPKVYPYFSISRCIAFNVVLIVTNFSQNLHIHFLILIILWDTQTGAFDGMSLKSFSSKYIPWFIFEIPLSYLVTVSTVRIHIIYFITCCKYRKLNKNQFGFHFN